MTVQAIIEQKLTDDFQPDHLEVINESHKHNVPAGSESHFRVVMVSSAFNARNALARHRMVNKTLVNELANKIHALALRLHTPEQWEAMGRTDPTVSPPCAHS